jgi:hypothetical protein
LIFVFVLSINLFASETKHFLAGGISAVSGYSLTRLITLNKYRSQPNAEEKRRLISLFSGITTSIAAGFSKEVIWDLMLKKGEPSFEDFKATFSGGITFSILSFVLDKTFIKRKEKQTSKFTFIFRKNSFYFQIKF